MGTTFSKGQVLSHDDLNNAFGAKVDARLSLAHEYSAIKSANQAYARFFVISGTGRYQPQGFVADEVGRCFYVLYAADQTVAQFDLDGAVGQVAMSSSLATTRLGHQGLSLEYTANGSMLWSASANVGKAVRFAYVAGAQPDNSQEYQFFDGGSGTNYTSVTITDDQRHLVAINAYPSVVRVYSLATLIASGPGDYRSSALYEWSVPLDQFPGGPSVNPFQAFAARGSVLYILAGLGQSNTPCSIYGYNLQTGAIISKGDSLPIGTADAAKVEAGDYNEPEGIGFVDGKLAVLCTQGSTAGRRSNRIYLCARKPSASEQSAAAMSRWNSAFAGSRYTSARQALIKSVLDELIENGIYERLSFLYLANSDSAGSLINLANPRQNATLKGAVTFTADRGWKTDGTSGYIDTGLSPMSSPNVELNSASFGAYILGTGASSTVLGTAASSAIILSAHTAGGNFSSRLNQTAADNFASAATAGHFALNRSNAAGYDKYLNGALVKTVTYAADTFISSSNVILLGANGGYADANTQLAAAHGGLSLTATQMTVLYNGITRYLHELGAV